jgi:CRISPR type III-associated protein (TIGR04423 family)
MEQIMNNIEIIEYINTLDGYRGYVQFSHRPIDKERDIFVDSNPVVEDEEGFVYEAHFCNDSESITIKQINENWLISKSDISSISHDEINGYITDIENFNYKVKMARIWEKEQDPLCEDMEVKKLKKVVFLGFEGEVK